MQFQRFHATSVLALVAILSACGDSSGPRTPAVASVRITPQTPSVAVGANVQLQATALDESGQAISGKTASWSSNATAIAEVAATTGVVTGRSAGTAQITASIDGRSASTTVTVTPPPVASITIAPASPSVEVGATVQMSAVLRAADNTVLTGRTVAWSSSSTTVATIGAGSGVATGVSAGTTQITATSEGRTASVTLTVTPGGGSSAVTITNLSPNPLQEGTEATITGTGFSATASANTVLIDGVPAGVLAATETSLRVMVPSACLPARKAAITVTVAGSTSAPAQHPATPASTLDMAVGEFRLLSDAAALCLQLAATASPTEFVFGVQSTSELASSLTPVLVRGEAATGAQALTSVPQPIAPLSMKASAASTAAGVQLAVDERMLEHRRAHVRYLDLEASNIAPLLRAAPGNRTQLSVSASAATIPVNPQLGDTVPIRVLDIVASRCDTYASIKTVVRHISDKGIFLADVANPAGGFVTSHYENLGTLLDDKIMAVNEDYFGSPGDIDGNARIAIVFTKEVNTMPALGFVTSADRLDPATQCAVSNFGEVYYSRAPDPTGLHGDAYTLEKALDDMPPLLAHELTHIIQNAQREATPGATTGQAQWEKESQAMIAEEVVGHAFNGYQPGSNLGLGVWLNSTGGSNAQPLHEYAWYYDNAVNLALYFGLQSGPDKVPNAPEQCTFLGNGNSGNTGPCVRELALYTGWSFLRWLSDHYGAQLGGEQQLHRRLIANTTSGFTSIANLTGTSIDELLGQWAASLYLDDRHAGLDPLVTLPSWNMFEFNTRLNPESGRLAARQRTFSDFADNISVRAPSSAYYRISGTSRPATAIRVTSQSGSTLPSFMRVWVVRVQ